VDRDGTVSASRNDDVGVSLAGFHELQVHWTDRREVLIEDLVQRPATCSHVPPDPPDEAYVCVCVHEDLDLALGTNALVREKKDSIYHDDIRGLDTHQLV